MSLKSSEEGTEINEFKMSEHVENGLEDMERGKGKLGRSERVALTSIHYQM